MSIRLTPHILSVIDWANPFEDPIRRQFLPMKSSVVPDHPKLTLDSLGETVDSPVEGLVHRYPDKALFLGRLKWSQIGVVDLQELTENFVATPACPVFCRFCTRSYAVGGDTETVTKASIRPTRKRWERMFAYIESTPSLQDIVVSGGDSYTLAPEQVYSIGKRLISIPHIRRFRFASKGLAVCPSRIIDPEDTWAEALIEIANIGRRNGKAVALHTHFNHPNEITWVTRRAAQYLFEQGVTVRNQSVLLRGVNDDLATMSSLIRGLANLNIQPVSIIEESFSFCLCYSLLTILR
jgi:lysine 2,3-aminomutase